MSEKRELLEKLIEKYIPLGGFTVPDDEKSHIAEILYTATETGYLDERFDGFTLDDFKRLFPLILLASEASKEELDSIRM